MSFISRKIIALGGGLYIGHGANSLITSRKTQTDEVKYYQIKYHCTLMGMDI